MLPSGINNEDYNWSIPFYAPVTIVEGGGSKTCSGLQSFEFV